jgi:hypothetical protein
MQNQTPRSRIKSMLRMLWLRSRERSEILKQQNYSCQRCGIKQSKAAGQEVKVEVHHKDGIGNWDKLIDEIQKELLCSPEHLEVLCKECHKEETYK